MFVYSQYSGLFILNLNGAKNCVFQRNSLASDTLIIGTAIWWIGWITRLVTVSISPILLTMDRYWPRFLIVTMGNLSAGFWPPTSLDLTFPIPIQKRIQYSMRKYDDVSKLTWFQVCRKPSQASLTLPFSMRWTMLLQRGQQQFYIVGHTLLWRVELLSVELTHLLQKKVEYKRVESSILLNHL